MIRLFTDTSAIKTLIEVGNVKPLLSIIVPTHNSQNTILLCLNSIACQVFSDYEVIIQDGLSSDKTLQLIALFQSQRPSLKLSVYSELDHGVYDAMNKALDHSNGVWTYFLGSDDQLSDPMTLADVCKNMHADIDVIYGDVFSSFWNGRYDGPFTVEKLFSKNICHQSIFVRSSLFKKFGTFCLDFRLAADWEHNMRWFLDPSTRVLYIDRVIAIFSDGGLSSSCNDPYFDSSKTLLYLYHGRRIFSFKKMALQLFPKLLYSIRRRKLYELLQSLRSILLIERNRTSIR